MGELSKSNFLPNPSEKVFSRSRAKIHVTSLRRTRPLRVNTVFRKNTFRTNGKRARARTAGRKYGRNDARSTVIRELVVFIIVIIALPRVPYATVRRRRRCGRASACYGTTACRQNRTVTRPFSRSVVRARAC